ncbi:MAG: hypothetical protein SPH68_07800 [Candidatus Borkfalkiaceae bacterium]|nr:hypothetical protein [Clostridia bacterium]MDY6224043.1 hypothetical protein [Christensenellaceae bacterium]
MNKKLKRLNILLAGAVCAAAIGTGAGLAMKTSDASAETYAPTSVFTKSGATIAASESDAQNLAFTFTKDTDTVSYNRTLAWKWHETAAAAEYLSFRFALDGNFSEFSVTFETASLTATEHGKITNKLVFTPGTSGLSVELFQGDVSKGAETFSSYAVSDDIQVKLGEAADAAAGEFTVSVKAGDTETALGAIGNVGSNYAEYVSGDNGKTPLAFSAKLSEGKTSAECRFKELNKQSFALNGDGKIQDNAAPVLTLNDDEMTLALGETFSLETKAVDVLDKNPKSTITYYQWAPVDTEAKYADLTSGTTRFYDKTYKDGEVEKTVYEQTRNGRTHTEYVSIKYTLTDSTHTKDATEEDKKAAECMLAWYMKQNVYEMELADESASKVLCLVVEEDKTAPEYTGGDVSDPGSYAAKYQQEVADETADMKAGESESFYLPSFEKMFADNSTGYKSLKYTLCYKTPSNTSGSSSSNQSMNSLKLTVSSVGTYRFKLFAADKAGNVMKSKKPGETEAETITTDNIWEHDELPTFTFEIDTLKTIYLESDTASSRSDTGLIDVKYTDISFSVKGTPERSEYGLYFFDLEYFNQKYARYRLAADDLSEITFSLLSSADTIEKAAEAYAEALAVKLDASGTTITADTFLKKDSDGRTVLREIGEYNDQVKDENYPDNRYQWKPSDKSFLPAERGNYIVFGVFTDPLSLAATVAGYKAIDVSDKEDINPGESEWLKNNLVSVILFSIAGVMLILIIVLLFIKPSDETLEDVGAEDATKGKKRTKAKR